MNITSELLALVSERPWSLLVTGGLILGLFIWFVWRFAIRAIRTWRKLSAVLKTLRSKRTWTLTALNALFLPDPVLAHLWKEFSETLHEQEGKRSGQHVGTIWRSTVPAEAYFNAHNLVDAPLHTELFKHFPGIFTGLGIIGTFMGLLQGLRTFDVSDDPTKVRDSLNLLLSGVSEAFVVSAGAIAMAMLVTLVEKRLLAGLYHRTHELAVRLDGQFEAGAGEEYLSRLVASSEEAVTQAKQLKDAFVGELKGILQELTNRQIQASTVATQALGQEIREGIHSTLQGPLHRLGGLVESASVDHSKVASQLLQDAMVSFSQQLSELFGKQIGGINDLNQRTAQGMQEAVGALNQLVGNLESVGRRSSDTMTDSVARAIQAMETRQATINEQTRTLVDQMRQQMAASQTETQESLSAAVVGLAGQMEQLLASLQLQSSVALDTSQRREEALAERTSGVVTSLTDTMSALVSHLAEASVQMRQSVGALERTTSDSIGQLAESARRLDHGATSFAAAGERVTTIMDRAATVSAKMAEVSGALTSSSGSLQAVVVDYRDNRDALVTALGDIRAIVEAARREASMTEETLARIRNASDVLVQAQHQAERYVEGISDVLTRTHQDFAEQLHRTLSTSDKAFHEQLTKSVGLLRASIDDLEEALQVKA